MPVETEVIPSVADLQAMTLEGLKALTMEECKRRKVASSWVQVTRKDLLIDWLAKVSGQKPPQQSQGVAGGITETVKAAKPPEIAANAKDALLKGLVELLSGENKTEALTLAQVEALIDTRISHIKGMDENAVQAIVEKGLEAFVKPVRLEIAGKVEKIEGLHHERFATLLKFVSAGVNTWIAGPAGSGKTTAVEFVAKHLGLPFEFNGAIDSEHKLLGFVDANGRIVSRPFRKAFEEGGVYLFDEVDASMQAAVLAFNAALANGYADFPDKKIDKHPNFRAVAAGNTWNGQSSVYCGRAKQDAAFIDRFAYLEWPIDERLECALVGVPYTGKAPVFVDDPVEPDELKATLKRWPKRVQAYRAALVAAGSLQHIISPRATLFGTKLLAAGVSLDVVEKATLQKGLSDTQWAQIKQAAAGLGGSR